MLPAYSEALVLIPDGGEVCQDGVRMISAHHEVCQVGFERCLGGRENSGDSAVGYAERDKGSPHVAVRCPRFWCHCCWLKPFPPELLVVAGGIFWLGCSCAENFRVVFQGGRLLYGCRDQAGLLWGELLCEPVPDRLEGDWCRSSGPGPSEILEGVEGNGLAACSDGAASGLLS